MATQPVTRSGDYRPKASASGMTAARLDWGDYRPGYPKRMGGSGGGGGKGGRAKKAKKPLSLHGKRLAEGVRDPWNWAGTYRGRGR